MKCPHCGKEIERVMANGKKVYAPGVRMTPEEYERLCKDFGRAIIDSKIEDLSLYLGDNVSLNKYKDHNRTIRRWLKREGVAKGAAAPREVRVCPDCGKDMSRTNMMTCPRCGHDMVGDTEALAIDARKDTN